jgi:hypothetical protein
LDWAFNFLASSMATRMAGERCLDFIVNEANSGAFGYSVVAYVRSPNASVWLGCNLDKIATNWPPSGFKA